MTKAVTGRAAPCRGADRGWLARLVEQLAERARAGRGRSGRSAPTPSTLGYDRMVAGLGLQSSDLQRLLAGKLVLVGGQFRASNDWVEFPVHGQAPGVHYHAMALDNLIEDGADYRRNANDDARLRPAEEPDDLRPGLLRRPRRDGAQQPAGPRGRRRGWSRGCARGLWPALPAAVRRLDRRRWCWRPGSGVAYAHRSPINWIGIAACVAGGFLFYATRQTLPADILGSIEHLPWVRRVLAACGRFASPEVRGGPAGDPPAPRRPDAAAATGHAPTSITGRPPKAPRGGACPCSKLVCFALSLVLTISAGGRRRRHGDQGPASAAAHLRRQGPAARHSSTPAT